MEGGETGERGGLRERRRAAQRAGRRRDASRAGERARQAEQRERRAKQRARRAPSLALRGGAVSALHILGMKPTVGRYQGRVTFSLLGIILSIW